MKTATKTVTRARIAGETRRVRAVRSLMRRSWVYHAARAVVGHMARRGAKPYQVDAIRCLVSDFRDAYLRTKPCILTSAFVPTELVYGLGAVPYLPEAAGGLAASFGLAEESLLACESLWYSADLCSFHRAGLGAAALGLVPRPSAVVVSSHLCDGGKRSLYQISQQLGCPFYLLDVAYTFSDRAERRLREQLEFVACDLQRKVRGVSPDHMARAIQHSNAALDDYLELCRLRRHIPAPWKGSEALNYVLLFLWSWGSAWLRPFYRGLREHAQAVVATGGYPVPHERFRLLWLNLRPYYSPRMFQFLEGDCQASIAFEEYSYPYWARLDENDPYTSIARKMMANFGWGPIERRLDAVNRMVEDYSIGGAIQFAQWGCRQSNGGASILADHLRRMGIPFLNLDGDGVDIRNESEAQAMTRLGAFVELLESKRAR